MIDAHQHFWTLARDDYGWLSPDDPVLYRDFGPDELAPLLARAGISRSVLIQAAPTLAETRYLLGLATVTDWVAGVVGWVDLEATDVEHHLDSFGSHANFRGVRPMIQDIADDDWMLRDSVASGLRALAQRSLTFDALLVPRHLPRLTRLLVRHPDLSVVVDHAAKPPIRTGDFDAWASDIAQLAGQTTACCKVSGLVTEATDNWTVADLRPYVAHLLECFGTQRLLWGSDWPVVDLAGGFESWRQASLELFDHLDDSERAAIFGENAARLYALDPD